MYFASLDDSSAMLVFCFSRRRTPIREQKVAKAYTVFMDEELNKKYHFFLDNPVRNVFVHGS